MSRISRTRSVVRTLVTVALAPVVAGSLLAATVTSSSAAASQNDETAKAQPTIVLVHGAFADASSWSDVIRRLHRDGYRVVAAANPLRGLSDDAAYVRSVLDTVDGPVVLAGHSYGGSVITEAAAGDPDVKALVYIAAFIPDAGESAGELAGKFPGSTLGETLSTASYPLPGGGAGTELTIKQVKFHKQFAADVPATTAAIMAATQRPVSTLALEEKATKAAWKDIRSYALIAGQDYNIPPKAQQWMAERADARTVTVKDASHAVSVSEPAAVTDLIRRAARDSR
ncbi:pimeloyl-ACP methyl ester carboxylesterase [Nonomuraea polychroma]|uniref:Pimeloyl-ACP methyl ester carboxylesterase n=1 Tax=Nonomuraea polychroma TaxID=46176 RepID=A0A438LWI9_9ACTN|nr:alpha/beta hydrolase [Nonomuraea polychroma]RVX37870.1 pimeloyl-ACP methyl ester carboxylesterase [Nonomuraea polychroma]